MKGLLVSALGISMIVWGAVRLLPSTPTQTPTQTFIVSNYQMGFDEGFNAATQGSSYQAFPPCSLNSEAFGRGFCAGYHKGEK